MLDKPPNDLRATVTGDECHFWFVVADGFIEFGVFVLGDIRWVAQNKVARILWDRFEQISLDQLNAVLDFVKFDILLGDVECFGGQIDRYDARRNA